LQGEVISAIEKPNKEKTFKAQSFEGLFFLAVKFLQPI